MLPVPTVDANAVQREAKTEISPEQLSFPTMDWKDSFKVLSFKVPKLNEKYIPMHSIMRMSGHPQTHSQVSEIELNKKSLLTNGRVLAKKPPKSNKNNHITNQLI
jgi:hypothetical protein